MDSSDDDYPDGLLRHKWRGYNRLYLISLWPGKCELPFPCKSFIHNLTIVDLPTSRARIRIAGTSFLNLSYELQNERAFQKQLNVFLNRKKFLPGRKKTARKCHDVGLGFKTPKEVTTCWTRILLIPPFCFVSFLVCAWFARPPQFCLPLLAMLWQTHALPVPVPEPVWVDREGVPEAIELEHQPQGWS